MEGGRPTPDIRFIHLMIAISTDDDHDDFNDDDDYYYYDDDDGCLGGRWSTAQERKESKKERLSLSGERLAIMIMTMMMLMMMMTMMMMTMMMVIQFMIMIMT